MSGKVSGITVAELSLELDAGELAQQHCRARWGADHTNWRAASDGFIEGYKAAHRAQQERIDEFAEFRAEAAKLSDDYFAMNSQRAALQERIDEFEAQLFITKADAALPLFDAMGFGPMPAFPSIRSA